MGWFSKKDRHLHSPAKEPHLYTPPPPAILPPQEPAITGKEALMVLESDDVESNTRDPSSYGYTQDHTTEAESTKDSHRHHHGSSTPALQSHHALSPKNENSNHLNSLFNGHLMKWKLEAEEGSSFIRVPAFLGATALIVTAVVSLVTDSEAWSTASIVMSVCVICMSVFILILDGRFLATNPLSARAHLRNILTRNFNIFRYVWGRAILYIISGILSVAQLILMTIIAGAFMIAVGIIALFVGVHASRKFAALRSSLADESFLLLAFSNFDSDGDGYVSPSEFALLLLDLGMELDDRYTLKAFNVIDGDNDRRISFDEFNNWWSSGYIERGRKSRSTEEDYRRMD